jgi:hypothetical protein
MTLLAPVPFSQVIPALVIMLLAFAFLEEDGVLLWHRTVRGSDIPLDHSGRRLGRDRGWPLSQPFGKLMARRPASERLRNEATSSARAHFSPISKQMTSGRRRSGETLA